MVETQRRFSADIPFGHCEFIRALKSILAVPLSVLSHVCSNDLTLTEKHVILNLIGESSTLGWQARIQTSILCEYTFLDVVGVFEQKKLFALSP